MQPQDTYIAHISAVTEPRIQGSIDAPIQARPADNGDHPGESGRVHSLEPGRHDVQKLQAITAQLNVGFLLDEVLDGIYDDFKAFIPYERIDYTAIDKDHKAARTCWTRSEIPGIPLGKGNVVQLEGSSLADILATKQPHIINNLFEYLEEKPLSVSTQVLVAEGFRASLTCPLLAQGTPVGFIFFFSVHPQIYSATHVEIFESIANQVSIIIEKGRLVSELAAQKAAIEQKNEQLAHLNEMKNSFLGMAAHDLRNPLANVLSAIDLLRDDEHLMPQDQQDYVMNFIYRQTEYMLALMNDLLDLSHIESGTFSLRFEPVDIADYLQQAIVRSNRLADAKGMVLILDDADSGVTWLDPLRIQQVIDNLLSNAIKFSPAGSVIRIRGKRLDSTWRIEVQDEGPGVTDDDRQHIFQDFARLSATPTGGEKTTGLGLSISRRVVEAHKGTIGVDSDPGGATFWITLPQTCA